MINQFWQQGAELLHAASRTAEWWRCYQVTGLVLSTACHPPLSYGKSKNLCDALAALVFFLLLRGWYMKTFNDQTLHLPQSHGIWFLLLIKIRLCEQKKNNLNTWVKFNFDGSTVKVNNSPAWNVYRRVLYFSLSWKSAVSRFTPLLVGKLSSCWPTHTRAAHKQTVGGSAASVKHQCWEERLQPGSERDGNLRLTATQQLQVIKRALKVHDKGN